MIINFGFPRIVYFFNNDARKFYEGCIEFMYSYVNVSQIICKRGWTFRMIDCIGKLMSHTVSI